MRFFVVIVLISCSIVFCKAQGGDIHYKKSYRLPRNSFKKTISYTSGNASIYVDRDGFVQFLNQADLGHFSDTITSLSQVKDTVDITNLMIGVSSEKIDKYFIQCIENQKINIVDITRHKFVSKIHARKYNTGGKNGDCLYAYYGFYMPNDKEPFLSVLVSISRSIKFL